MKNLIIFTILFLSSLAQATSIQFVPCETDQGEILNVAVAEGILHVFSSNFAPIEEDVIGEISTNIGTALFTQSYYLNRANPTNGSLSQILVFNELGIPIQFRPICSLK